MNDEQISGWAAWFYLLFPSEVSTELSTKFVRDRTKTGLRGSLGTGEESRACGHERRLKRLKSECSSKYIWRQGPL